MKYITEGTENEVFNQKILLKVFRRFTEWIDKSTINFPISFLIYKYEVDSKLDKKELMIDLWF